MSTNLAFLSISEASDLVRKKLVSPCELTQSCLARIQEINPAINAYITVSGETALEQARELENELCHDRWRGPMHGIPIALKDLIDVAGIPTTSASAVFANNIPNEDAAVVTRLKAAGAVLLGKLNMQEFAYGDTSIDSHFGPVRNPWNREQIAGGSSGGPAAAVAAGLCLGALGSDTGGSIRQPAAYCGITGLKPTYGLVSTRGVVPLSWSLDHIGPMCRTVADAALLLQPIAGYDALDVNSIDAAIPSYIDGLGESVSGLRLGIPRALFYEDLDPEVASAVDDAIGILGSLTARVSDVTLPPCKTLPVVGAEAWAFHESYFNADPELYQRTTRRRLTIGSAVAAPAYIHARRELERLRRSVSNVFSTVDVLVTPTTPCLPATFGEFSSSPATPPAGGVAISLRNTQPFNVYGLPSISVPCGFSRGGLPVGLQITGPKLGERVVLALAHAYERVTEWHKSKPPI